MLYSSVLNAHYGLHVLSIISVFSLSVHGNRVRMRQPLAGLNRPHWWAELHVASCAQCAIDWVHCLLAANLLLRNPAYSAMRAQLCVDVMFLL